MNGHIHNAELGVILHLFLPKEGHGGVGVCSKSLYEVRRGDEHTATAAGRVYKNAVFDTNRKSLLRHISAEKGLK